MLRAFVPKMCEARRGVGVNVSSIAGRVASPGVGAYASSRWALEALTGSLGHERRPFGVSVALVEPGTFRTDIFHKNLKLSGAHTRKGRAYQAWGDWLLQDTLAGARKGGDPGEVARCLVDAVDFPSARLRYLVGTDAKVAGFLRKWLPEWAFLRFVHPRYGPRARLD